VDQRLDARFHTIQPAGVLIQKSKERDGHGAEGEQLSPARRNRAQEAAQKYR
jgi:hypothetical protein